MTEITTTLIQGSHLKINNNYLRTKPMLVCLGEHTSLTGTCMIAVCTQLFFFFLCKPSVFETTFKKFKTEHVMH